MDNTNLVYMEQMSLLELQAQVMDIAEEEGRIVVVLDQTVFYPQGGGQPYDQGYIESDKGKFKVEEVRFVDGVVKHIGSFETGEFQVGHTVQCHVNANRRALHTRLHSAGHVIDLALQGMSIEWTPGKGYHFPEGPYIEYSGDLEAVDDIDSFRQKLEDESNKLVKSDAPVTIRFMKKEEMGSVCTFVPDYLPPGKPARVVMYGDAGIPCGGTHVSKLSEVGHIHISKVKQKKGTIRVSYNIRGS